jgi:sugar-specific transcriptional regulator TrmB
MDIETALLEYGLDEKEIKAYLALLKYGKSSAHEISRFTGILRQTAYDTLNKLQQKGLITQVIENKKTYYLCESPESLIKLLKQKEKNILDIIPDLNLIKQNLNKETSVKHYKGVQGIRLLYEDFLESKTPIKTIQLDIPEKYLKEYFVENFFIKRVERKIPTLILKEKIESEFQKNIKTDKKKLREVRLSNDLKEVKAHIVIYDNKVVFLDYGPEPTGILIENEYIKKSEEVLFDSIWNKAKVY